MGILFRWCDQRGFGENSKRNWAASSIACATYLNSLHVCVPVSLPAWALWLSDGFHDTSAVAHEASRVVRTGAARAMLSVRAAPTSC